MNTCYKGLDLGKLIAAALIVLLHTIETSNYIAREAQYVLTRFAVPFFFITAGFFLAKGLNEKAASEQHCYIKAYITKLIKIYALWALVIYAPFVIYSYLNLPQYANVSGWTITAVLFRKFFVVGPGPYWFIIALLGSSMWCYITRNHLITMFVSMLVTFACMILYTCFRDEADSIPLLSLLFRGIDFFYSWEFNFLTYGIPFCTLGYLLHVKHIKIARIYAFGGFIVCTLLRVFEYQFCNQGCISICYIPQALLFFFTMLNYSPSFANQASKCMRSLSSFIYFSHAIILYNILNPLLTYFDFPYTFATIAILPKSIFVLFVCCILFIMTRRLNSPLSKLLTNG